MSKIVQKLKVEMNIPVMLEDIDDIMVAALEGGITYWCDCAKVQGDYLGEYASDQIGRGGILLLHDMEEDEWQTLTHEKFMRGLKMYLQNSDMSVIDEGKLDCCQIDADIADQIVQYAIFGEVVYG